MSPSIFHQKTQYSSENAQSSFPHSQEVCEETDWLINLFTRTLKETNGIKDPFNHASDHLCFSSPEDKIYGDASLETGQN
jgi:hypothetical protein